MQSDYIIIGLLLCNIAVNIYFLTRSNDKYYEDMKGLTNQFVSLSTQLFNYQQNKQNSIPQIADVGDDPTPPATSETEDEAVYAAGEL